MELGTTAIQGKARQLINDIANGHTLNGTIFGTQLEQVINNCLEILSEQLYEKSTHFLLELIQNADDNAYTCSTPTLSFIYKPGSLRIDCNEVGFNASNVAAICGISQSTKSGRNGNSKDKEAIGEKGIGFKSVFKAAEVVWIASNEFTFKFDRTRPLGVITPLWEEFPEQTGCDGTSIFLKLSGSYDEQTLVTQLREFDTNILIFLRRVEMIKIEVNYADSSPWEKQIRKASYQEALGRVIVLESDANSLKYLIRTTVVGDLPQEAKRKGFSETNVLLAFPLPSEHQEPTLRSHNVYAFLPIRNYGFKFLIQADFILTASREDIESTLSWNMRIRDALSDAFLSSMLHFNKGVFKYLWPLYLPSSSTAMSGFFEPTIKTIISQIKDLPVFESCVGNMVRPSALAHVPTDFCIDGEPLTLCGSTKDRYLSSRYPSWVMEPMKSVGVIRLTPRQFVEDLATMIATDAELFHSKTSKWHERLARALVKHSTDIELMDLIQDLPIVPLSNGTWTAARDNNIFFATSNATLAIPDGIRVMIMDSDVPSDPHRRTLFTCLGVKTLDPPEICRVILSVHGSADFHPELLDRAQLVSHATYLYQAKWQPPKGADLWFATARNIFFHGREMYIPGSSSTSPAAARIFSVLEKQFPVVHTDYLRALPGDSEWLDWLVQNLGLSKIPRLITPIVEPRSQPIEVPPKETTLSHTGVDISSAITKVHGDNSTVTHNENGAIEYPALDTTTKSPPLPDDITTAGIPTDLPPFLPKRMMAGACTPCRTDNQEQGCDKEAPKCGTCSRYGLQCSYPKSEYLTVARALNHEASPYRVPDTRTISSDVASAPASNIISTEPFPSFEEPQSISACNNCESIYQGQGCDRKHPTCGTCTENRLDCHYFNWSKDHQVTESLNQGLPRIASDHTATDRDEARKVLRRGLRSAPRSNKNLTEAHVSQKLVATHPNANEDLKLPEKLSDEVVEAKNLLFDLSEEFEYMLHNCTSADVFQLVRDNWHHYSQWLEGPHLEWQSQEYMFSSMQLKNKIGASMVQTIRGPLPLNETVLANLDMQLEQNKVVPALQVHDPDHVGWNMLTYFGVIVKCDIHYYLRCLITLSRDQATDADVVGYVYEQIQSRYTGNERLIRAVAHSQNVILVNLDARSSTSPATWTNMNSCMARGIDLTSTYANCSYLFRCLYSTSGDPIGGLVHAMTMISSSSKLEDITRLFRELNKLLKDVNSTKVALLLKPLQDKAIFPIIVDSRHGFDTLLSAHDKTWFIADSVTHLASFTGKIPLLGFPIQDLMATEDLLRALKVDTRKISDRVTDQTRVVGRTRLDSRYTEELRLKSPFIKALIPRNHPAEAAIKRQIAKLYVRIATSMLKNFTLALPNQVVHGEPLPGYVTFTSTDSVLTLMVTEDIATAEYPSHELVSILADICGIEKQSHITLLSTALCKLSVKSTNNAFLQQGIHVEGLLLDDSDTEENALHLAEGIDEARMPSPFPQETHGMSGDLDVPEGLKFEVDELGEEEFDPALDRRIPMLPHIKGVGNTYSKIRLSDLERKEEEFIECDHMQFLGENMVARVLDLHLGSSFDPVQDWTSDLRERAGFTYVPEDSTVAPFTLTRPETIRRMTDFVLRYGVSQTNAWQDRLRNSAPTYHVDVIVSGGSTGRFVMEAKWIERTMRLKLPHNQEDHIQHVNILVHVDYAYSEVDFRLDIIVDPWYLLQSGKIKFTRNWLMQGSIGEERGAKDEEASLKKDEDSVRDPNANTAIEGGKELILYTGSLQTAQSNFVEATKNPETQAPDPLYIPWSQTESTGILQSRGPSLHTTGRRELYSYKPLLHGYMRLLYLLPGTSESSLQAVLNHIACNYAGTYQALSYVWGSSVRDKELVTPNGIIPITTSLYKALIALRQSDQAIMVWVDAVCINQADYKEKAQQIRLLPEIFQACECTYAFLSEGDPAINQALEMLMQVRARAIREERKSYKGPAAGGKDRPIMSMWEGKRLPAPESPMWESVFALFTLPYFRRAWIIQEVVASPAIKFVCGTRLIGWNDLYAALQALNREVEMSEEEPELSDVRASWEPFMKLGVQREWEARQHRWCLITLLEHFRHAESTLSRDRFFTLVGLASDGNDTDFEPDYESSFHDIVLRFAYAFVRQGRGIQLLYRAGITSAEHESKFPSWIPDWTVQRPVGLNDSSDSEFTFSACGPSSPHVTLGPMPNDLSVDGYNMDVILAITTTSNTESEWEEYFVEVDEMIDQAMLSDTLGPKEDLKWKVPVAAAPFTSRESYKAFREYIADPLNVPTNDGDYNAHKSYGECLQGTLTGWKFVITKRGFAGVVPSFSQVDDVVAIMKGGCVPFLLRESGEKWRLVGECFVHGIMKGEGLWLPGVKEDTFCLH